MSILPDSKHIKHISKKELSVFDNIMGGMTKEEAKEILKKFG